MKRPRLSSAPIFVQVLLLVLFTLAAAHLINVAVVLFLPDPRPLGFSVAEAARALQGEAVVTDQGQRLRTKIEDREPELRANGHEPLQPLLAGLLARELGVERGRVRVGLQESALKIRHAVHSVELTRRRDAQGTEEAVTQMFVTVGPEAPPRGEVRKFRMRGEPGRALMFPAFSAALQRADGRWVVLEPSRPWLSPWQLRTLVWFGISVLLLTPLAWLIARRLARPIHAFAEAAERLGSDPGAPPLETAGPAEVRAAAAVFNDMQDKLRRYVEARTAMVAAIAHDLRTPLTRMRFRIEGAPPEVRDKVAADIEQMDAMVSQALTFVRGEDIRAERLRLDIGALVQSVVDDLREVGLDAEFEGGGLVVEGDPVGLRRLVTNLIENAVKFGRRARVSLAREGDWARLLIEDEGPGLSTAELDRVFEPFHRSDPARAPGAGGFGLGLPVARSIARAHGGDVTLRNRSEGGLAASVRLPLPG